MTEAERALVQRGWALYGQTISYGTTTIVTAMAGVDGMCRPLGFQAFVYSEGRYAGSLSPVAMNSRTDGALTSVQLTSPTQIVGEFSRYSPTDPLCCPRKLSTVRYTLQLDELPNLVPKTVTTIATGTSGEPMTSQPDTPTPLLYDKRWVLTQLAEQSLSGDKPYLEFSRELRRASGDSGCNRFAGGFELNGSALRFLPIVTTKRACLNTALNRLETSFLQQLSATTRFEVETNELRLYAGDRLLMVLTSRGEQ
jgi:heat shock protein HslJ